jgi:hypothetical protein
MERSEDFCCIGAGVVDDDLWTTWVIWQEIRHVVYFALWIRAEIEHKHDSKTYIDDDPSVVLRIVLLDFIERDELLSAWLRDTLSLFCF